MTIIRNRLVDPSRRPLQRQTVRITAEVFGAPFLDGTAEIRTEHAVSTDRSGLWSADLIPTSQLGHPDAYYRVDQSDGIGRSVWAVRVPDTGGPYWLVQCLVSPPTDVEPADPGLPSGVGLVYVRDEVTGIYRLVPLESAGRWGDEVRFSAAEPPPSDAPVGAVWVNLQTGAISTAT